jgi:hypothetical protein
VLPSVGTWLTPLRDECCPSADPDSHAERSASTSYDWNVGVKLDRLLDDIFTESAVSRILASESILPTARPTLKVDTAVKHPRPSTSATRQTVYISPCQECLEKLRGSTCIGFCRRCEDIRNGGPYRQ